MSEILPLAALGRRIVVLGPSNAGKSTLAVAIARRLGVEAVHLDQFRHLPNTDWQVRPDAAFLALHNAAILGERWVMDGNYSALFPQRFARATGAIVLGGSRWLRLWRYLGRTLSSKPRAGSLPGNKDSIKWEMVQWVFVRSPGNDERYMRAVTAAGLPAIRCRAAGDLDALYRAWDL